MADYTKPQKKVEDPEVPANKPKKEQIVKAKAKSRNDNAFRALRRVFLADDISNIKEVIFEEVLLPSIRDTLYNSFENAIHILFYGTAVAPKRSEKRYVSNISYSSMFERNREKETRMITSGKERYKARLPDAAIGLSSAEEAENLLNEMVSAIEDYGFVSVLEFKEYIGEPTNSTDNTYGWINLEKAAVKKYRDTDEDGRHVWMWALELPKPGVLELPG